MSAGGRDGIAVAVAGIDDEAFSLGDDEEGSVEEEASMLLLCLFSLRVGEDVRLVVRSLLGEVV